MNAAKRKDPPNLHILRLSFLFFFVGALMFLIAMAAGIWFIPDLVQLQSLRNPKGWALAHLLLLGWATMIAMGASFQITQVIMRIAIFSRTLGYVQFVFYVIGVVLLIVGFYSDIRLIVVGGTSITVASVLYVLNIGMTFVRKKEWNLFVFGVSLSLLAYLLTITLGMLMGLSIAYGWDAWDYHAIFSSHMWLGIGGWLSGLILVYSFKLLPMFYVSRKKLMPLTYWMIGGYHFGIWLQIISIWCGVGWLSSAAWVCLIITIGFMLRHFWLVREQSSGKTPIGVVKMALYLMIASFVIFVCWCLLEWWGISYDGLPDILIIWLVAGWFTGSILSYLSKILPFLWWAHRYRTKEQKKSAVLLSEMLPEKRMTWILCGYLLGIMSVICGFVLEMPVAACVGQIAAVGFLLVYSVDLLRVFRYD